MTTTLTKLQAKAFAAEVEAATASIFTKYGMDKPKISTRYGTGIKITLDADPLGELVNGVNTASDEASAYKRYASSYGLVPDLLGRTFILKGEAYRFSGISVSRRRYPFSFIRVADGKPYFFTSTPNVVGVLNGTVIPTPPMALSPAPAARTTSGRQHTLDALKAAGYNGPTSYTLTKLQEVLADHLAKTAS